MGGDQWETQWWVQAQLADAAQDGLWDRSDITTATFEDQGTALLSGSVAMVMQVDSFFAQLQAKSDTATLDSSIGFFPISPSGTVGTFIPDQSNALVAFRTGETEREEAARQLLSFWLTTGYQDFVADRNTVSLQTDVADPSGVPQAMLDVHEALATSVGSR